MKKFFLFCCLLLGFTCLKAQNPDMYFADETVPGRPYAKDPYVIYFKQKYWMYYSTPDAQKRNGISVLPQVPI